MDPQAFVTALHGTAQQHARDTEHRRPAAERIAVPHRRATRPQRRRPGVAHRVGR
jgi:hypothetical protein